MKSYCQHEERKRLNIYFTLALTAEQSDGVAGLERHVNMQYYFKRERNIEKQVGSDRSV